jgi:ABC-type dipeptide/oligopeptide/nickel transport system permease component
MSFKRAITIILVLAIVIAIVFAIFYFYIKKEPKEKALEQIIPKPTKDPKIEIQTKELDTLRSQYKVNNNSDAQLKRQYEELEALRNKNQ